MVRKTFYKRHYQCELCVFNRHSKLLPTNLWVVCFARICFCFVEVSKLAGLKFHHSCFWKKFLLHKDFSIQWFLVILLEYILRLYTMPQSGQNIWDKLWFLCEIAHYAKRLISIFKKFCVSIDKIFILQGRLGSSL